MDIDLTWEPEPEPEWTKAPAVLAKCPNCYEYIGETVHLDVIGHGWMCGDCQAIFDYTDTKDVVPLYPLPTREDIAVTMYEVLSPHYGDFRYPYAAADAVLELMKGQDR